MLYQSKNRKYRVEVGPDGAIKVKHGDWLSKYSSAIYNNYWNIRVFRRKDAHGKLVPITNPNLIFAGETLYHLPTFQAYVKGYGSGGRVQVATFQKPEVITGRRPPVTNVTFDQGETIEGVRVAPMSEAEKRKFIIDHLKGEYHLRGEHAEFIAEACDKIHESSEYVEIAETLAELIPKGIVELLPKAILHLLEAAVEAGVVEGLSIVGALAFSVYGTIKIVDAYEFGQRLIGFRAIAYGITSWAFEEGAPPPPAWIRVNVSPASLQKPAVAKPLPSSVADYVAKAKAREEGEVQASLRAWKDACESARKNMDEKAEQANANKKLRATWRYLGDGERQKLAKLLMVYLDKRYLKTDMERSAFWSPEPSYPN